MCSRTIVAASIIDRGSAYCPRVFVGAFAAPLPIPTVLSLTSWSRIMVAIGAVPAVAAGGADAAGGRKCTPSSHVAQM